MRESQNFRLTSLCNFKKVICDNNYIPEISCPTDQGLCLQQQRGFAVKALPKYNQLPTHPLLYHNCELQRATQVPDTILLRPCECIDDLDFHRILPSQNQQFLGYRCYSLVNCWASNLDVRSTWNASILSPKAFVKCRILYWPELEQYCCPESKIHLFQNLILQGKNNGPP